MSDQEDIMLTFRQKIQLNNNEHMFFRQEVESWRDKMQNQLLGRSNLEDISYIESSEEEESSDPGDLLLKKGNSFSKKGEWARAISMYTSAISKKRTARYYTARALVYLKQHNLVEAEKDCTEAINLEPQLTKAYIRRALARKLLGKCKESCDDMEIILKLNPDNEIVAMEYEAMLDYLHKDLPSVEGSNAEHEKQETAMKLKQLGNDFVSRCQYKKAIVKFTSAITLNPEDPTFYGNRAICHMKLKEFVSAEKDCSKALELDGKYAKVYLRRARVRKCLGKVYESRQDFYSTFELTQDEKVLEELEEVERSIKLMETHRRNKGEEIEKHAVFSIVEIDDLGNPKQVQLDRVKLKSNQPMNVGDVITKEVPQICSENGCESKNGTLSGIPNEIYSYTYRSCLQQTNTQISIPTSISASIDELSTKYDVREVFPLKRDDSSAKFSGPFIRIIIEDAKFAAPEKLLEIPDDLMRNLSLG